MIDGCGKYVAVLTPLLQFVELLYMHITVKK